MSTSYTSYGWLRELEPSLKSYDSVPLMGQAPAFDFAAYSKQLSEQLGQEIVVSCLSTEWRKAEELKAGFGAKVLAFAFSVTPLSSEVYALMDAADLDQALSAFATTSKTTMAFDPSLHAALKHLMMVHVLYAIEGSQNLHTLSPRFVGDAAVPLTHALCFDISVQMASGSVWCRLAIPPAFRGEWLTYFKEHPELVGVPPSAHLVEVALSVQMGHVSLTAQDWAILKRGDFVALDYCDYNVDEQKGSCTLVLNGQVFKKAKLRQNQIKIQEPKNYEDLSESAMEEENVEEAAEASDLPDQPESTDLGNMPINLTIEVTRLKMRVSELMNLAPGNILDLGVDPKQGVQLLLGSKHIGSAELVKIGDTLGIVIRQISKV